MSYPVNGLLVKGLLKEGVKLFVGMEFAGMTLGSRFCCRDESSADIYVDILRKIPSRSDTYTTSKFCFSIDCWIDDEITIRGYIIRGSRINPAYEPPPPLTVKPGSAAVQVFENYVRSVLSNQSSFLDLECVRLMWYELDAIRLEFYNDVHECFLHCESIEEENAEKAAEEVRVAKAAEERAALDEKYKKIGEGLLQAFDKLDKVTVDCLRYTGYGEFSMIIFKKSTRRFSCNLPVVLSSLKFVKGHVWGEEKHYLEFSTRQSYLSWNTQYDKSINKSFAPDDLVCNKDDVLTLIAENIVKTVKFDKIDEANFIKLPLANGRHRPISLSKRILFPSSSY